MSKKTLYLIDGANYVYRAYYAIRPLSNSKGLPTNALYGFTQMILKLLRDEKPDHIAVIFDTKEPTFRDEMYEDYKANREAPPDDLIQQFPYLKPILEALNIPVILFCRGSCQRAAELASLKPAAISFDAEGDLASLSRTLPPSIALQGNLDPEILRGEPGPLRTAVRKMLSGMAGHPGYICNLGHGILPDTPIGNVEILVDLLRNTSPKK